MKFLKLVEYFEKLEATSKRLEMFHILSQLFKESNADDIDKIIYLGQGELLPPFHGLRKNFLSGQYQMRRIRLQKKLRMYLNTQETSGKLPWN